MVDIITIVFYSIMLKIHHVYVPGYSFAWVPGCRSSLWRHCKTVPWHCKGDNNLSNMHFIRTKRYRWCQSTLSWYFIWDDKIDKIRKLRINGPNLSWNYLNLVKKKKYHVLLSFHHPIEIILFIEILTLMKLCRNWRTCNGLSNKSKTI